MPEFTAEFPVEVITEGEVRVGAVSRRTMAPAAMPESLYEKIRALLDLAD